MEYIEDKNMKNKPVLLKRMGFCGVFFCALSLFSCQKALSTHLSDLVSQDSLASLSFYLTPNGKREEYFCPNDKLQEGIAILDSFSLTLLYTSTDYYFSGEMGVCGVYNQGGYFVYDTCGYQHYTKNGVKDFDKYIAIEGALFGSLAAVIPEIPEKWWNYNYWNTVKASSFSNGVSSSLPSSSLAS
jgi:hypothetical protein